LYIISDHTDGKDRKNASTDNYRQFDDFRLYKRSWVMIMIIMMILVDPHVIANVLAAIWRLRGNAGKATV